MYKVLKLQVNCKGPWYSSPKNLKRILTNVYSEECFIIALDKDNKRHILFSSDLGNKKILIGDDVVKIPEDRINVFARHKKQEKHLTKRR